MFLLMVSSTIHLTSRGPSNRLNHPTREIHIQFSYIYNWSGEELGWVPRLTPISICMQEFGQSRTGPVCISSLSALSLPPLSCEAPQVSTIRWDQTVGPGCAAQLAPVRRILWPSLLCSAWAVLCCLICLMWFDLLELLWVLVKSGGRKGGRRTGKLGYPCKFCKHVVIPFI